MSTADTTRAVRLVLTVEEAAECLGIGRALMYALIAGGDVESVRIGRLRRVSADALEAFVSRLRHDGPTDPDSGSVRRTGRVWTVGEWLTTGWRRLRPAVRESTLSAYRVAVDVHLIPGVGAHRLDRLEPEHLERLYATMVRSGSAPAIANQVHPTIRTALGEAECRGRITRNPAKLAKAPRPDEIEVEPSTVDEVRLLLKTAGERRNSARWAVALALGLRQGEALGLRWSPRSRRRHVVGSSRSPASALLARMWRDVRTPGWLLPSAHSRSTGDRRHRVPCGTSRRGAPLRAGGAAGPAS